MNDKITEEEILEFLLPQWAIGRTNGEYILGAHLATKDGRRMGNAHIIDIRKAPWDGITPLYTILTDAGTKLNMIEAELRECFHPTQYVSNVTDVLLKFERDRHVVEGIGSQD